MRVLLTGFGPFGEVIENPSGRLASLFAQREIPGIQITTRVLPVSYARAASEVRALLREGEFNAAVLLGVARSATEIRLESQAANEVSGKDCDGRVPTHGRALTGGPESCRCELDLESLRSGLVSSGIPAALSANAGAYVCNHTYYAALHAIEEANLACRCLFVHLPPHEGAFATPQENPVMPLEEQARAVEIILAALRDGEC